jgi:hypothetical protein
LMRYVVINCLQASLAAVLFSLPWNSIEIT